MEILFELLLDVLSEGVNEASQSKKVPKPIRYAAIVLVVLFCAAAIGLILFVGAMLMKEKILGGSAFLMLGIFMAVMGIAKFRKVYLLRQDDCADADSVTNPNERTEE